MFAVEIDFQDGITRPETVFVKRPIAVIGKDSSAHVIIDEQSEIPHDLLIVRGIGREFSCIPWGSAVGANSKAQAKIFSGTTSINLGKILLQVTALDFDLRLSDDESLDRAGLKSLRQVCLTQSPVYPAIKIQGPNPAYVSFNSGASLVIGRGKTCDIRLDSASLSREHARLGFDGNTFWVEDLGSTNGVSIDGQRISGRESFVAGAPVLIGGEITILGLESDETIEVPKKQVPNAKNVVKGSIYPVLVSTSSFVKPNRLELPREGVIVAGRDPANDFWVGAAHISRRHFQIEINTEGLITLTDLSTNGTFVDGRRLEKGQTLEISENNPAIIDLKEGIKFKFCFNKDEEAACFSRIEETIGEDGESEIEEKFQYKRDSEFLRRGEASASESNRKVLSETMPVVPVAIKEIEPVGAFQKFAKQQVTQGSPGSFKSFEDEENEEDKLSLVFPDPDENITGGDKGYVEEDVSPFLGRGYVAFIGFIVIVLFAIGFGIMFLFV